VAISINWSAMLEVCSLEVRFGEVRVLAGVDLRVGAGEIVALIGPNGAGKTTLLKTISGLVKPARGRITFDGVPLVGLTADAITARGIAHVPEGRRIFPQLTVEENLKVGGHLVRDAKQLHSRLADVYRLFPRLCERRRQFGQTLSGGEQQMLALGRAMVSRPQLLLLDEPSLGLAPLILVEVARAVPLLRQQGASILLVEQNANLALALCNRGYVMDRGQIVLTDTAANLRNNPKIIESYLGGVAASNEAPTKMSMSSSTREHWPT
jgi:branched-chain amino acid transport system ATP-binding protein